eukprot:2176388-Rhodomonas_salina.3
MPTNLTKIKKVKALRQKGKGFQGAPGGCVFGSCELRAVCTEESQRACGSEDVRKATKSV